MINLLKDDTNLLFGEFFYSKTVHPATARGWDTPSTRLAWHCSNPVSLLNHLLQEAVQKSCPQDVHWVLSDQECLLMQLAHAHKSSQTWVFSLLLSSSDTGGVKTYLVLFFLHSSTTGSPVLALRMGRGWVKGVVPNMWFAFKINEAVWEVGLNIHGVVMWVTLKRRYDECGAAKLPPLISPVQAHLSAQIFR